LAAITLPKDFVETIADEVSSAVEKAVDCWMSQIDGVLTDTRLTSLGRLNAVVEILENYKHLTGKSQLECHRVAWASYER
jgi:hypothetical protein